MADWLIIGGLVMAGVALLVVADWLVDVIW